MAAVSSAKIVNVSAMRLMGRRHSIFITRSAAEMKVPAWPIPMKNTKFVIYSAHSTGRLSPVMPMPQVI